MNISQQDCLISAILRTRELTEVDMRQKSSTELLLSMICELGELAREVGVEDKIFGFGHKKPGSENSIMESVDNIIMSLASYFARGGTIEDLGGFVHIKLNKWQSTQTEMNHGSQDTIRS